MFVGEIPGFSPVIIYDQSVPCHTLESCVCVWRVCVICWSRVVCSSTHRYLCEWIRRPMYVHLALVLPPCRPGKAVPLSPTHSLARRNSLRAPGHHRSLSGGGFPSVSSPHLISLDRRKSCSLVSPPLLSFGLFALSFLSFLDLSPPASSLS